MNGLETPIVVQAVLIDMGSTHVRVPDPVYEVAGEVKEERDLPSMGEAIRYMVREGGYDV